MGNPSTIRRQNAYHTNCSLNRNTQCLTDTKVDSIIWMKLCTRRNCSLFNGKYWMLREMSKISQLRAFSVTIYCTEMDFEQKNYCIIIWPSGSELHNRSEHQIELNRFAYLLSWKTYSIWWLEILFSVRLSRRANYHETFRWTIETCCTIVSTFPGKQFHGPLRPCIPCIRCYLESFSPTEHQQSEINFLERVVNRVHGNRERKMGGYVIWRVAVTYQYHPEIRLWLEKNL